MTHREVIEYLEQRNIEISRDQISKIMKVWRETGTVSTGKKRPGRPRKLSDRDRRHIYMTALRNRRLTARDIPRMPEMNVKNASSQIFSKALDLDG